MDDERDCCEDERDDWNAYTYNAWKGGRIPYAEACAWEDEDDDDDDDDDDYDDDYDDDCEEYTEQ